MKKAIIKDRNGGTHTIKADLAVESDNPVIAFAVRDAYRDYSPALGDPLAYVADRVATAIGGTVVSVDLPEPMPPGTIY